MTGRRSKPSLGTSLDRTRWDYAPRDRSRRDLLSPAGSLFSSVPWDQTDGGTATTTAHASAEPEADQEAVSTLR